MYEVEPGSDIFVVKKISRPEKELLTRVYALKNATVQTSQITTNREYSTTDTEEESSDSSTSSSSSSSSSSEGSSEEGDALEGIAAIIKNILTADGKILEDPRTNSLIITDIPSQFPIIERTIAKLDAPAPQVLIEVEMIDISKRTSDLLGIKYGSTLLSFTGATRETFYPWDENKLLSTGQGVIDPVDRYTAGTIDASGMTAILQFLKTQTDTKTLATPKILTLNNQTAKIAITTNEAIGIKTTTGGSEGITTQSVEAERAATGVFLTVTPQVNEQTGEITMAVVPLVAEARAGATFGTSTFRDPEIRGSNTLLRIKNNETIYIGGLKKTVTADTITKLPLLGDLPLVGGAFRHKNKSVEERELIIFITPKIVADKNYVAPEALSTDLKTREQDYPNAKRHEIEKALLITEQQRKK
jgi:MSHA biogenesis protein MshL